MMREFYELTLENAIDFRLKAQLIFLFCLEADKAFLAVPDPKAHLDRKHRHWHPAWVDQKIGKCEDNPVNLIRKKARAKVVERTSDKHKKRNLQHDRANRHWQNAAGCYLGTC